MIHIFTKKTQFCCKILSDFYFFNRLQDVHTSAFFTYLSMNRWFGVALDWTITVYSAICVFSFMLVDDGEMMAT